MLTQHRLLYQPQIPSSTPVSVVSVHTTLSHLFPQLSKVPKLPSKQHPRVGVVFSGGPAAGGHNVIVALFDQIGPLVGFLDGPAGVVHNRTKSVSNVDAFRNQGGFDLLGTGRDKIETDEQLASALKTVQQHKLDALVVIGGDDSNTNAAVLAEYFLAHNAPVQVIGIPKTIDGDLRCDDIELSFGFDSACKTYGELIGNVAKDALSTKKYYHFIKLMGRSASHIALECGLNTQPNLVLIGEERKSLQTIVDEIVGLVQRRAASGKNYGVILVPEGLIEFVPELKELSHTAPEKWTPEQKALFSSFPDAVQKQLLSEKDPHGNVAVSQIETEKILLHFVKQQIKIQAQEHFFGYEGRCCLPSNFDANFGYALGVSAAAAIRHGLTGVICGMRGLHKPAKQWIPTFVPIVNLLHLEERHGKQKPVIRKALVDLHGKPYLSFAQRQKTWQLEDHYCQPGPIQFFGPAELTDTCPTILVSDRAL